MEPIDEVEHQCAENNKTDEFQPGSAPRAVTSAREQGIGAEYATTCLLAAPRYQYSLVTFANSRRSGRIQPRKGDGRLPIFPHRLV